MSVVIPDSVLEAFERAAERRHITVSEFVEKALGAAGQRPPAGRYLRGKSGNIQCMCGAGRLEDKSRDKARR